MQAFKDYLSEILCPQYPLAGPYSRNFFRGLICAYEFFVGDHYNTLNNEFRLGLLDFLIFPLAGYSAYYFWNNLKPELTDIAVEKFSALFPFAVIALFLSCMAIEVIRHALGLLLTLAAAPLVAMVHAVAFFKLRKYALQCQLATDSGKPIQQCNREAYEVTEYRLLGAGKFIRLSSNISSEQISLSPEKFAQVDLMLKTNSCQISGFFARSEHFWALHELKKLIKLAARINIEAYTVRAVEAYLRRFFFGQAKDARHQEYSQSDVVYNLAPIVAQFLPKACSSSLARISRQCRNYVDNPEPSNLFGKQNLS